MVRQDHARQPHGDTRRFPVCTTQSSVVRIDLRLTERVCRFGLYFLPFTDDAGTRRDFKKHNQRELHLIRIPIRWQSESVCC